ncbi:MAG: LptF/LptG family permease [Deltaproteobacteria bacterium]|nr:LptF/LptG family permease [Deltaproteobacteria bacterium]
MMFVRFILRLFIPRLLAVFIGMAIVAALFEFAERGTMFQRFQTPWTTRALLVLFRLPGLLVQLAPIIFIFATLWTTATLARHRETTALRAIGIPATRILWPILAVGLVGSGALYVVGETWVPAAAAQVDRTIHVAIQGVDARRFALSEYVWFRDGDWIVYVRGVEESGKVYRNAVLFEMGESAVPRRRIDAAVMELKGDTWTIREGRERRLDGAQAFRVIRNEEIALSFSGANFEGRRGPSEEMSFSMLAKEREQRRAEGRDARALDVGFFAKAVFPLTLPLVVWLVGVATLRWNPFGNFPLAFAIGLAIVVPYLVVWNLGLGLGKSGVLPPAFAATAPHFVPVAFASVLTFLPSRRG